MGILLNLNLNLGIKVILNLHTFSSKELFWKFLRNFFGIFLDDFFAGMFMEEFFGRNILEGFFWRIFFEKFLGGFFLEKCFLEGTFWEELFVYIVKQM